MSVVAGTIVAVLTAALPFGAAIGQVDSQTGKPRKAAPTFGAFRVLAPIPARKQHAEVSARMPNWEQQLAEVAKQGPDFAAYFAVAQWTCGSLCVGFGILDVRTAELHPVAFNVSYFCPDYKVGSELEYRLDSRLFIVSGRLETYDSVKGQTDGPCGQFYFEWNGRGLRQIDSVISTPQPNPSDAKR